MSLGDGIPCTKETPCTACAAGIEMLVNGVRRPTAVSYRPIEEFDETVGDDPDDAGAAFDRWRDLFRV